MNFDKPLNLRPCCMNLRHKMMYCDPRQSVPGTVDAESETRVYFCIQSQDSLGPDGKAVHPSDCGAGRSCHCSGRSGSAADEVVPVSDELRA